MSSWTYINGIITVEPLGRTQPEKKYILDTVLDHLPRVTGSEGDMEVYSIQRKGFNSSCSADEFGNVTNNLVNSYGDKSRNGGWLRTQDTYLLVVDAALRDRVFKETLKEFNNWLCRLAKRIDVRDVLVEINGYDKSIIVRNINNVYRNMFEYPSWSNYGKKEETKNWCEYLMWQNTDD